MGPRGTTQRRDVRLRATVTGTGDPGPIEARLGRRLLELVSPDSAEGRALLASGQVEIIGPEGDSLGRIGLEEACERLRRRAEALFEDPGSRTGGNEPPPTSRSRVRRPIQSRS